MFSVVIWHWNWVLVTDGSKRRHTGWLFKWITKHLNWCSQSIHNLAWLLLNFDIYIYIMVTKTLQIARSGHSVVRANTVLILFGGEDAKRRKLNDLHMFDLKSLTWLPLHCTWVQQLCSSSSSRCKLLQLSWLIWFMLVQRRSSISKIQPHCNSIRW